MKIQRTSILNIIFFSLLLLFCLQASAYYDPGVQRWINRDPLGEFGHRVLLSLPSLRHSEPGSTFVFVLNSPPNYYDPFGFDVPRAGDRPSQKDCMTAKKLLKEYERLMKKLNKCIPEKKLAELNRKRDAGTITSNDLPGSLQKEFPGRFTGWILDEILDACDR